jgi:SAM-dependent methyltransferase
MTPRERAEHYAQVFPQYPRLRYDDRWLDGVWLTGQDYRGSGLHGSYPPKYLDRIRAIFPDEWAGTVLHLCSGSLDKSVGGVRVELSLDRLPVPDVYGDAECLPFADQSFDLILADIPYTAQDAKKYNTEMVNRTTVIREATRVLKVGGHLVWLDIRQPMFRKSELHWWGVISLVISTNHLYRAATFYQRKPRVRLRDLLRREYSRRRRVTRQSG